MKKDISLSKQASILMAGQGAGFVIAFVVPLVIVRLTNAEEYGTYKQFFLIFSTVFYIAQLGMVQSIYFFVPGNKEKPVYVTQSYLILLLSGVFLALILVFFNESISQLLNNPGLQNYLPLLGLFLFFMLGASLLEGLFIAETKIVHASISFFLTEVLKSASMLLPLVFAGSLYGLFVGIVVFGFVRFSATLFFVREYLQEGLKKINRTVLAGQFSYALPLAFSSIFTKISYNLHNYFISYYFPPEIFAIFAVGLFYPPIVEIIEGPIIQTMFVAIVKHLKAGEIGAIRQIWHNSIRKISLAMFPILAFSVFEAERIISILFTKNYLASVPIFTIAIFRIFFIIFIPNNIIKAYGKTKYILYLHMFSLSFYFVMLLFLVNQLGFIGAAVAIIVNEFLVKAFLVNKARTLLDIPLSSCLPLGHIGQGLIISCISIFPSFLFNYYFSTETFMNLIVSLVIFLSTYVLLVYKSSLLTMDEKNALLSLFSFRKMLTPNS